MILIKIFRYWASETFLNSNYKTTLTALQFSVYCSRHCSRSHLVDSGTVCLACTVPKHVFQEVCFAFSSTIVHQKNTRISVWPISFVSRNKLALYSFVSL